MVSLFVVSFWKSKQTRIEEKVCSDETSRKFHRTSNKKTETEIDEIERIQFYTALEFHILLIYLFIILCGQSPNCKWLSSKIACDFAYESLTIDYNDIQKSFLTSLVCHSVNGWFRLLFRETFPLLGLIDDYRIIDTSYFSVKQLWLAGKAKCSESDLECERQDLNYFDKHRNTHTHVENKTQTHTRHTEYTIHPSTCLPNRTTVIVFFYSVFA